MFPPRSSNASKELWSAFAMKRTEATNIIASPDQKQVIACEPSERNDRFPVDVPFGWVETCIKNHSQQDSYFCACQI
jgi:hypothetical protein